MDLIAIKLHYICSYAPINTCSECVILNKMDKFLELSLH